MHCKYDKCEIYQTRVRVLLFVFASFEFQLQIYLPEDIATIKTLSQNISAKCRKYFQSKCRNYEIHKSLHYKNDNNVVGIML